MEKKIYKKLVEDFFNLIETKIEEKYDNIDVDRGESIIKITDNKTEIIVNTQEPLNQIWIASRKNGYQFSYTENSQWYDKRKQISIEKCLKEIFKEQYKIDLNIFD